MEALFLVDPGHQAGRLDIDGTKQAMRQYLF